MFCLEAALFWGKKVPFDRGGPLMGRSEPGTGPGQGGSVQGRLKDEQIKGQGSERDTRMAPFCVGGMTSSRPGRSRQLSHTRMAPIL